MKFKRKRDGDVQFGGCLDVVAVVGAFGLAVMWLLVEFAKLVA